MANNKCYNTLILPHLFARGGGVNRRSSFVPKQYLPGKPGQFHFWPEEAKSLSQVTIMPVLFRPANNFVGQVIGSASEGKYNTLNNTTSEEVTFQKCLNSGII